MKSFSEIVRHNHGKQDHGKHESKSIKLCKFYMVGCPRIECPHLHSIEELQRFHWKPKPCRDGENCETDRRKNLSDWIKPCPFFHPDEPFTRKEIINRLVEQLQPVTKESAWRNSQLCPDGLDCEKRDCIWAHHQDELVKPKCVYGRDCQGWSCPFYHQEYISIPWSELDDEPINFDYPLLLPFCPE